MPLRSGPLSKSPSNNVPIRAPAPPAHPGLIVNMKRYVNRPIKSSVLSSAYHPSVYKKAQTLAAFKRVPNNMPVLTAISTSTPKIINFSNRIPNRTNKPSEYIFEKVNVPVSYLNIL